MSGPKLTPWFPGRIKPVRPGVYEVFWYLSPVFARWDGERWCHGAGQDAELAATVTRPACDPPSYWRGLAEQPK